MKHSQAEAASFAAVTIQAGALIVYSINDQVVKNYLKKYEKGAHLCKPRWLKARVLCAVLLTKRQVKAHSIIMKDIGNPINFVNLGKEKKRMACFTQAKAGTQEMKSAQMGETFGFNVFAQL